MNTIEGIVIVILLIVVLNLIFGDSDYSELFRKLVLPIIILVGAIILLGYLIGLLL